MAQNLIFTCNFIFCLVQLLFCSMNSSPNQSLLHHELLNFLFFRTVFHENAGCIQNDLSLDFLPFSFVSDNISLPFSHWKYLDLRLRAHKTHLTVDVTFLAVHFTFIFIRLLNSLPSCENITFICCCCLNQIILNLVLHFLCLCAVCSMLTMLFWNTCLESSEKGTLGFTGWIKSSTVGVEDV